MKSLLFIATLVLSLIIPSFPVYASDLLPETTVLINEIKSGGAVDSQPIQFVELVNLSENEVDLNEWKIEYAKTGFVSDSCQYSSWENNDTLNYVSVLELSSVLPPSSELSYSVIVFELSITDNNSGSIQLIDNSGVRQDIVGWGDNAPCLDGDLPATSPANTKSIERYLDCDGFIQQTNDNQQDFSVIDTPSPGLITSNYLPVCTDSDVELPVCADLEISEILPNPSGSDQDNEFIELYNSTNETINLESCILKIGSNEYIFTEDSEIEAKQYKAFYDSLTSLTLPNASGGELWLIMTNEEHIVTYPGDIKDDTSWSSIDDKWYATSQTPNLPNVLPPVVDEVVEGGKGGLTPCPPGKYRNPETNRCKNVFSSSNLTPCKIGQVRNPETNRCRSVAVAGSSLTPCKAGQERNPATNRCRSVAGASTTLTPCKEGYERNPETNRCRKSIGILSEALKQPATVNKSKVNYSSIFIISLLIFGYGVYEYRQEISEVVSKIIKSFAQK